MILTIRNKNGSYKIDGTVYLQGAKNSMLNNLLLPLLTEELCVFKNVPQIEDIATNINYLKSLGAIVEWYDESTLAIQCNNIIYRDFETSAAFKTTGSKYFIPFMVHRFGEFITGPSGGDQLGSRHFADYADSLSIFGILYERISNEKYRFYKKGNNYIESKDNNHYLKFPSLGLTINSIFSCINADIDFTIHNTCQEPEIDNTIDLINQMGGSIARGGKGEIIIKGKRNYKGGVFRNMSDRNVAVSFAMLAVISKGKMKITNFDDAKMGAFYSFLDLINCGFQVNGDCLEINAEEINSTPVRLKAYMYPDIHSDWQPLIAPLLTSQYGTSYVEEYLFPFRLGYWKELEKLGAIYEFDYSNKTRFPDDNNPHAVYVHGPQKLNGNIVKAIDLRGGMSLIIASLVTKGSTIIENAEEIFRGYDKIDIVLRDLGIDAVVSL